MKISKIMQVMLTFMATCFFVSCTSGNSSSSQSQPQEETIWEGLVQPGTYSGDYVEDNGCCINRYSVTLTIYDDEEIKLKEVCRSSCGSGAPQTKIFYGYIHRYIETYDGERKVWYGVVANQEGGNWQTRFNLSTSLDYSPADCDTYQTFSRGKVYCTLH